MRTVSTVRASLLAVFPLAAVLLASASPGAAQAFPSKVITIVVPTAPATPPDIISRVIATELSESEGWRVVVENKPGAVLTIGGSEVLKHPADGHTIYAMALPVSAAPAFLPNMPPARNGLRARHQDIDVIQRARCESVRGCEIHVRSRHAGKEPAGQAQLLVRRFRDAGPPDCGDVQA